MSAPHMSPRSMSPRSMSPRNKLGNRRDWTRHRLPAVQCLPPHRNDHPLSSPSPTGWVVSQAASLLSPFDSGSVLDGNSIPRWPSMRASRSRASLRLVTTLSSLP